MKWSIHIFICGAGVLLFSLLLSPSSTPRLEPARQPSPTSQDALDRESTPSLQDNGDHQSSDPLVRTVLNTELPSAERLQPMVDGRLWRVESKGDIAALRATLSDPHAGDTFRNEVANLLFRSEVPGLTDDLLQIIRNDSGDQRDRFRSFAVQHLGLLWERAGYPHAGAVYEGLLTALDDPYVPLVRNAAQALARGGAPAAKERVQGWLSDGRAHAYHDLCARLVADHQWRELIPAVRDLLDSGSRTVHVAALDALGRLGDLASRAAFTQAAQSGDRMLAATGERGLAALADHEKAEAE